MVTIRCRYFAVWNGGIGLWGGILGGWIAGMIYAYFAKAPIGTFMDIAAAPLLVAQTIGRIGDIINGEHWSRPLDLFWGWYFTDIDSPARAVIDKYPEIFGTDVDRPVHPAVVYEMIANIIILGVIFALKGRVRPCRQHLHDLLGFVRHCAIRHPIREARRREVLGVARGSSDCDLGLDRDDTLDHLEGAVYE